LSAAWIAALFLSVAQEVKRVSRGLALSNSATCSGAVSITLFSFEPNR